MDSLLNRPLVTSSPYRSAGLAVRWVGYALFFLMLFVPSAYPALKATMLGIVVGGVVADTFVSGRVGLDRRVLVATLGFTSLGAYFILRGLLAGAPGALQMFNVYVTWPLVYAVLVAGASRPATLHGLVRVAIAATVAVAIYSIVYVLWAAGYWPDVLYYAFDQGQAIGFHGAYVEFGLYSTSTLLFMMPFLVATLFVFPGNGAPVRRSVLWVSLALALVTVLLTGRRALLVLVPLAPMLALAYRSWLPAYQKREGRRLARHALWGGVALGVILATAITWVGGITPDGFIRMVGTGFQFGTDPVAMSRRDQFLALIEGWRAQPLLGSGHGAPAPGVIRSDTTPWAYELSYVSLLYHTGIIGTLLYSGGVAWIGYMSYRIARRGWSEAPAMVATLVGASSFLVANATNPYLEKYDYLWVIFLPLAFVNCYLMSQRPVAHVV